MKILGNPKTVVPDRPVEMEEAYVSGHDYVDRDRKNWRVVGYTGHFEWSYARKCNVPNRWIMREILEV